MDSPPGNSSNLRPTDASYGNSYDFYEITYLAIGCYHTDLGGPQQYPPFLARLMDLHPDWHLHLILVDPELEDPPHVTTLTAHLSDRICLTVSRRLFCHQIIEGWEERTNVPPNLLTEDPSKFARKEVDYLVHRTLNSPIPALFFVHDYTGYSNSVLSARFRKIYGSSPLYRHRCLVDIGYDEETGCFFDMSLEKFSPLLYHVPMNLDNQIVPVLSIFDPRDLTRPEMISIMLHQPSNPFLQRARDLVWMRLERTFQPLRESLAHYRYFRLAMTSNQPFSIYRSDSILFLSHDLSPASLNTIHQRLSDHLNDLSFFESSGRIVKQFVDYCQGAEINPYEIINQYENMIIALKQFYYSHHSQYEIIAQQPELPIGITLCYQ